VDLPQAAVKMVIYSDIKHGKNCTSSQLILMSEIESHLALSLKIARQAYFIFLSRDFLKFFFQLNRFRLSLWRSGKSEIAKLKYFRSIPKLN
jgi:hypothetical protein